MEHNKQNHELTHAERNAIRKLATEMCANYDSHYNICLTLDCPCYMLNKYWTGSYCKFFQNAVLPLDSISESTMLNKNHNNQKTCPVCGAKYVPVTSRAYCSDPFRIKGQRETDRQRKRDRRRSKR